MDISEGHLSAPTVMYLHSGRIKESGMHSRDSVWFLSLPIFAKHSSQLLGLRKYFLKEGMAAQGVAMSLSQLVRNVHVA